METTVKGRLILFLKYLGVGQKKFAQSIEMSDGYVNAIRKSIQPETISKIAKQYPDLNTGWLLTGDGEMLKSTTPNEAEVLKEFGFMNVPFVPIHAHAGYSTGYGDNEYLESLPTYPAPVDKNYKGKYRVFEVKGDSMDNADRYSLYEGDKVLCREIKKDYWKTKLHIKDWYFVIVTINEGIVVKQIIGHNTENNTITCHSLNPMFDDFEIHLKDVAEIYNVIKIIDRNARI